jgi:quinolinate synthase
MDDLPEQYSRLDSPTLLQRIAQRKTELGKSLCILGHHYQSDEVIQFADFTGDSLKLSQLAAAQTGAKYIVFCGVHFMAESADILSSDEQVVCLPNLRAGCAMADMADEDAVATALKEMSQLTGGQKILPITYVNSTAAVKALTGQAGGACCTSSNVRNVFLWALGEGGAAKVFAIPDEHLGRNTAVALGYGEDDCAIYDPRLPFGGLTAEQVRRAKFLLWKGFCYVHQIFRPEHIAAVRRQHPGMKVIVHPECPREVVAAADAAGSTEQIIRAVTDAPTGSAWAIGTEGNLVARLARQNPDKTIRLLSDAPAGCYQMARIDLPHLLWCLDRIAEGSPVNVVTVPPDTARDARLALRRMIDIKAVLGLTRSKT